MTQCASSKCRQFKIALCLLWVVSLPVFAANDRGLIFRAQRGDAEIVLLGSIHLGDDKIYPLRPTIESAFKAADALVVELDIGAVDSIRIASWMTQNGQYPAGETIRDHIEPQTWQRLQAYLHQQGLPPEGMERYKPGILVNMLTMLQLMQGGLSAALGLDQHFLDAAHATGKPIIELETAEDQLALLASMPNADATINAALDEIENLDSASTELFTAWKLGDGADLAREIDKEFTGGDADTRDFFARLFTQRNRTMTQRIIIENKTRKKLFVVIGAGHLLADEGVVALLKREGFKVEQL